MKDNNYQDKSQKKSESLKEITEEFFIHPKWHMVIDHFKDYIEPYKEEIDTTNKTFEQIGQELTINQKVVEIVEHMISDSEVLAESFKKGVPKNHRKFK